MRALSNRQIARAAAVVIFGFLTSGLLGLIRTAAISATFGASDALDAFYAAQRIPEMIFVLVAGGALGSSFIPVFSRLIAGEDRAGAWRLASAAITLAAFIAGGLTLVVALLAPWLVPLALVPGKAPDVQALTISLTQMMLITTVIFSVSGLMMGILNAHQSFFLPALAPSMYNLGLIFGALVLARILPPTPGAPASVYGLALGAILGAALHLIIQLPGLRKLPGLQLRILPDWDVPGVREVITLMGPRVLGLGIVQINFTVNAALASTMLPGSYTALNTAWFLMFFTLGIIGQSIGSAVFPTLSALAAEGDMGGFTQRVASALRGVLFLAFPAMIGLIVFGSIVVNLLFERGEWTAESTAATAWALSFFALGMAGHALLEVLSRAFYALADTLTPVLVGVASMVANIILSLILIRVMGTPESLSRGPFAGLALANSLTTIIEALVLWWLLRRRVGSLNDRYVLDGAWRALVAALGMGGMVGLWLLAAQVNHYHTLVTAFVGIILGAVAFFGIAFSVKIDEARTIPYLILRRFRR
jgi:putative peptidoglycan lipid II flippase